MLKPGLILRRVKNGVNRWVNPEAYVVSHEAKQKKHSRILRKHEKDFDWIASQARKKGHDFDEHAFTEAKADHLHLVKHALENGTESTERHLSKLRIYPWEGQNNAGYHPKHNAIFIGSEAMAGGHKRYGTTLGRMVMHETAHALDHEHGFSGMGREFEAKLSRRGKSLNWLPPELALAASDSREWGPRLLELHLSDPKKFDHAAKKLKKHHDVDVKDAMKRHMKISLDEL